MRSLPVRPASTFNVKDILKDSVLDFLIDYQIQIECILTLSSHLKTYIKIINNEKHDFTVQYQRAKAPVTWLKRHNLSRHIPNHNKSISDVGRIITQQACI